LCVVYCAQILQTRSLYRDVRRRARLLWLERRLDCSMRMYRRWMYPSR